MFCTNCGNQNDDMAVFCSKCGTPVNGRSVAANVKVKSHMVEAILQLMVCLPAGIIPLIYACKVNSKLIQGDIAGAQAASRKAKMWLWITTVIFGTIILLMILAGASSGN